MAKSDCVRCIHSVVCKHRSRNEQPWIKEHCKLAARDERPRGKWVQCSDRLPTAEDGERVLVHLSFDKPTCEYVYIPWKTVGFEYQVGHIDAWFAIPKYEKRGEEK